MPLRFLQVVSCSFYMLSNILCYAFATQVASLIEILGLSGREPLSPSNICPRDGKQRPTHLAYMDVLIFERGSGRRENQHLSHAKEHNSQASWRLSLWSWWGVGPPIPWASSGALVMEGRVGTRAPTRLLRALYSSLPAVFAHFSFFWFWRTQNFLEVILFTSAKYRCGCLVCWGAG